MRIINFEGLRPRHSPRSLDPKGAQTAHNLMPNTVEFRPMAQDSTVIASTGGASDPQTLFRFQRVSGGLNTNYSDATKWRIHAGSISYAKMPSVGDSTDRHAYTTNNGTAAPRVVDNTGDDRQLGVPTPGSAPTVSANVVDEFTVEERGADIEAAKEAAIKAVKDSLTLAWRGAPRPGTGTTGYIDRETAYGFAQTDTRQQVRMFRLSGAGGSISDAYAVPDDDTFSWIFDPLLGGFATTTSGSPSWAGSNSHWAIPFPAYGVTYDVDSSALSTTLTAITMPGKSDGTKLFTGGQVTNIVNAVVAVFDVAGAEVKPRLERLASEVVSLKTLLDGGGRASVAAQTQAFYSKTDVDDAIDDAINTFAKNVFQQASNVARASLPDDYAGAGGGP
ncbi:hypothetical protein [Ramlibacter sp.]|uniref:hypothetical protein n=1 Tax=Ramlibacter sp. TaxID=1917967 RepID=UPI003D10A924